jgi:hypothetical protein
MKEKIKWILEKAKEQPAALKIMEMIVTIITTLIIFSGNMISCHSNRTTQVEKNRIEEKKVQIDQTQVCRDQMNDQFSSVKNSFEKLARYVKKIQILELKWREGNENPEVFNDADRTSVAEIFNDLNDIIVNLEDIDIDKDDPDIDVSINPGKELKDEMEKWLITFYPSVKGYSSSFSSENHYIVTLANIANRGTIATPKTGGLEELENKFTTYKNYINRIIEIKMQRCENKNK